MTAPVERTPHEVNLLADVIADANAQGIRFGPASLARHILAAGYTLRPNQPNHQPGQERVTHTLSGVQRWRQYGWLGGSGALYSLSEDPSKSEPGSFMPLWALVDNEPPITNCGDES